MQGNIGAQARRVVAVLAAILTSLAAVPANAEPGSTPGHYDFHPGDTQYRYPYLPESNETARSVVFL
jgi:hypothetical protein